MSFAGKWMELGHHHIKWNKPDLEKYMLSLICKIYIKKKDIKVEGIIWEKERDQ
jgi:hypothetical protein